MASEKHLSQRTGDFFLALFLLGICLLAHSAAARPMDWPAGEVTIHVQDQPLRRFLEDFFAALGTSVILSDGVQGEISGQFEAPPGRIFDDVRRAYGLVPYFDGTAMHIGVSRELESETFKVAPRHIERVVAAVIERQLGDERHTIEVHSKSGTIAARGAPQFIADVRELVRTLTPRPRPVARKQAVVAPPPQRRVFRTFELQYASAADVVYFQNGREVVLPGVATLLRNMVGDGYAPRATGPVYNRPADSTLPGRRGQGLRRFSVAERDEAPGSGELSYAPSGRASEVRIEAEPNLNAVIVRDYADAMPLYEGLIEQLDVEPNLIEIRVTIIDVDQSALKDLGVNWRYQSDDTSAAFGGGEVLQQQGGLLLNTVLGNDRKFFASVNALAQEGSAKVVSRPQIVTVSNLEAVLASDQTFFVRVAGQEEVDLFDVSVGTSLRVVPNVVGDRGDPKVRLLVTIEDGTIDAQSSVDDIPVVERSSLTTQAIVFDGESLLIGGLVREDVSTNTRKVPLLGDVPALGRLFRRDVDISVHSERLFLISPKIIGAGRGRATEKKTGTLTSSVVEPAAVLRSVETAKAHFVDGF